MAVALRTRFDRLWWKAAKDSETKFRKTGEEKVRSKKDGSNIDHGPMVGLSLTRDSFFPSLRARGRT